MGVSIFTDSNFQKEVLDYKGVVLIDFWAAWCGPCQIMGPIVESLAEEYQGKIKVGKVDVDANRALASQYGIMSIPTIMIFKNGKLADQMVGVQPGEVLKSKIDPLLKKEA